MSAHAAKLLTCLDLAVKINIAQTSKPADGGPVFIASVQGVCTIADHLIAWFDDRMQREQAAQARQFAYQVPKPLDETTKTD